MLHPESILMFIKSKINNLLFYDVLHLADLLFRQISFYFAEIYIWFELPDLIALPILEQYIHINFVLLQLLKNVFHGNDFLHFLFIEEDRIQISPGNISY